jgi:hypothetical protein
VHYSLVNHLPFSPLRTILLRFERTPVPTPPTFSSSYRAGQLPFEALRLRHCV